MICRMDAEHKGIDAIVQCESSPHYAGAWCKECGQWIKWMNRAQYDDFRAAEEAKGTSLRRARDRRKRGNEPRQFTEQEIREIVRDELDQVERAIKPVSGNILHKQ